MCIETSAAGGGVSNGPGRGAAAGGVAAAVLLGVCAFHWDGFVYPNYVGAVVRQVGTLALFLIWAWPGRRREALGLGALMIAAYGAFSALSALWAPDGRLAAVGSVQVLFSVAWGLLLGTLLRDMKNVRVVIEAVFLAGAVAALAGLYYVVAAGGDLARVETVQGHRNFLAIFLLPPILAGAADLCSPLLVRGMRRGGLLRLPVSLIALCLGVMLAALLACRSVGGFLGLLVGGMCLACIRLSRRWRLALAMSLVLVAVVGLLLLGLPPVTKRLLASHPEQATRRFMWQGALRMALDRPLFGWGAGMFLPHFADYKPTLPMRHGLLRDLTIHPHNEPLMVAAEGGAIALALYLVGLFLAVRACFMRADAESRSEGNLVGWAVLAGFAAMFAQGLVSVALRFWAPATLYWTMIGLMLALPRINGGRRVEPGTNGVRRAEALRFVAVLVAAALVAWSIVWSGARAEALMACSVGRAGVTQQQKSEYYARAAVLSRYVPDHLIALRRRARLLRLTGESEEAIAAYAELNAKAPGYGPTRRYLALLYARRAHGDGYESERGRRDLERAVALLLRAVRQNPYDAKVRVLLAQAMSRLPSADISTVIEHARAAVRAEPDAPKVHYELARFLAKAGKMREALDALERADGLCDAGQEAMKVRISMLRKELLKRGPAQGPRG